MKKNLVVLAIGGNSLIKDKKKQTVQDQYDACLETAKYMTDMIEQGKDLVITHGNGPQVGFIWRRSELAQHELHTVPLDSCGADTQGAIGYMLQKALYNEFVKRKMKKTAVTIVTQVLVDKEDKSFKNPSKPIGSFMTSEEAVKNREEYGWNIVEDAGRGYRRVVASPIPKKIIELDAIKFLINAGYTLVAVGGGGIPVVEDSSGLLTGVEAVIDKDFASSLLASEIGAETFVISTEIDRVYLNFGKPNQKALTKVTLSEIKQYMAEDHFKPGSMLPKIKAVIEFLEKGGKEAIITNPENLPLALKGEAGTLITK